MATLYQEVDPAGKTTGREPTATIRGRHKPDS